MKFSKLALGSFAALAVTLLASGISFARHAGGMDGMHGGMKGEQFSEEHFNHWYEPQESSSGHQSGHSARALIPSRQVGTGYQTRCCPHSLGKESKLSLLSLRSVMK